MKDFNNFLAWELTTRDTIDFKKIYVDMAGDLIAGLMLSQIIYWYLPDKDGTSKLRVKKDGYYWIAKAHSDWYEEIRVTEWQAPRALKILEDAGIIEKKLFRFDGAPTVHIRIIYKEFMNKWEKELEKNASPKSILGKASNPIEGKPQIHSRESLDSLTESTAENTTKNKDNGVPPRELNLLENKEAVKPLDRLSETKKPDFLDGMIQFAKSRDKLLENLYDYPVHHQDIIKEFSRRWRIFPPPKGTSNYKKWCGDAKDVDIMLTNAELPIAAVFDEAYYVWKTPPAPWEKRENFEKFTVTDLGSTKNLLWVAISNLAAGNPARKVKIYTDAYGNPIEVIDP